MFDRILYTSLIPEKKKNLTDVHEQHSVGVQKNNTDVFRTQPDIKMELYCQKDVKGFNYLEEATQGVLQLRNFAKFLITHRTHPGNCFCLL